MCVWGGILFGCRSCRCPCSLFSVRYLLNQWMNFDPTCIRYIVGRDNELIRLRWTWPYFQGHSGTFKYPKYGFSALSPELVGGFWLNWNRYMVGRKGSLDQILVTLILFQRSNWHFEMSKIGFQCIIFWISGCFLTKLAWINFRRRGRVD